MPNHLTGHLKRPLIGSHTPRGILGPIGWITTDTGQSTSTRPHPALVAVPGRARAMRGPTTPPPTTTPRPPAP